MRQGQNSKRSRGRGSGRRSNVPVRHQTFDSNGPSVRIRGSAYQVHEKYLAMARDAAAAGDRIAAENYMQHAEHYFRIINADGDGDGRGRGGGQRAGGRQQSDQFAGDSDADNEDAVVETVSPPRGNGADAPGVDEGSEQPNVQFPNGEDVAANPRTQAEAAAPKKPRAPRTPRGRGRTSRASGDSGGDESQPSQPEE